MQKNEGGWYSGTNQYPLNLNLEQKTLIRRLGTWIDEISHLKRYRRKEQNLVDYLVEKNRQNNQVELKEVGVPPVPVSCSFSKFFTSYAGRRVNTDCFQLIYLGINTTTKACYT